ncbi:MAG: ATP-binding cassette domain-containing protein [Armatimonadetes bacterium]|nr:ATP-binding cassette domain-containing protein [Armatimonadota bacterium]
MESMIELESVCKSYAGRRVIDHISFQVGKGEIFGLLGPNGAGKTTILRMLTDILRPDSGRITVLGSPAEYLNKHRIGYLPEERGLYKRATVLETLVYFGMLKGMGGPQAKESALAFLKHVELLDQQKQRCEQLSKGMQQKVQLVASLVHRPDLVIFDEPFSGLDPVNIRLVQDILLEMQERGCTVLLSTHQMDQVERLCTRLTMIHQGKLVLYGSLEEVRSAHADNSVSLAFSGELGQLSGVRSIEYEHNKSTARLLLEEGTTSRDILDQLVRNGVAIRRFEVGIPRLDEIFVAVVEGSRP